MAEVNAQLIKELRDKTGVSMMECKKALVECACDMKKAEEWLKFHGMTKADKKKDKETGSGRVGSYIHANGKIGVLVEIGCETDFVANNTEFQDLLKDVALQIAAMKPFYVARTDIPDDVIEREKAYYLKELNEQQKGGKEKPAAVLEKILEGKMEKLLYNQKCLMEQSFIKDESMKIADIIKTKIAKFGENIVVKKFQRFEIGQQ